MGLDVAGIGSIADLIKTGVDKFWPDKASEAEKMAITASLTNAVEERETKVIEAKKDVIIAEAQGGSWLQRNWRPITMLVFVYIIAHNFIFAQLLSLPILDIPPDMWSLLKLGIGGYIMGRSAEKGIKEWKK